MSLEDQDRRAEQERVERVVGEIARRVSYLQQHVSDIQADIVQIRRNFWDDVTVNFDDDIEAAETYASIKQQAEVLSERERVHRHAHNQLKTLKRLQKSPYFGRIDFRAEGEGEAEQIYLGIGSFLDEKEEEFLVYDWRAPVSSLYYDYSPGPAAYETPSGTIQGTMELKRQFIIRDGELLSLFDTGVTIGDELLQQVLGKQADGQMKSIVATIQKEQNRIIRDVRKRLLIVQGAAGSGKTSAALQRVAYLLYRYRGTLQSEQIVLFSPNPMFNSYISTVLPELGEENMQQTTYQEYVQHRLGDRFQVEDRFAQMEYIYTAAKEPGYEARAAGIRYKASTAWLRVIDAYLESLREHGMCFRDLKFRGRTLISAQAIAQRFYEMDASLRIPNRIRLLAEWLLGELKQLAKKEISRPWVDEAIELLDRDDYQRVYQQLRSKKQFTGETFNDFDREREMLALRVVQEHFAPLRKRVKRHAFVDHTALYRQLFEDPERVRGYMGSEELPAEWAEICRQTLESLSRMELRWEDATPFLYLRERVEGFQTHTAIRHVFIDEAQDYSPFQFAFLKRLFPHARLTVLGDLNQAIYAHATGGDDFAELAALYGEEETEKIILTRSYRSTRPIVLFTSGMIPGGDEIEPFNRDGKKPTVTRARDRADLIARISERIGELQSEGHRTIAVICKTAEESREAYEALRQTVALRLIDTETVSFEEGVHVIPAYLAKGVEFDGVILYDASREQYGREQERKLFYTACTRAMHELHLYYRGEMTPFVAALQAELYEDVQG
ncbi:UvrD-helicase domain-containing protein [Brevibacillus composti]|uniref:UvrD-helicase domain-containing protein n=1 Tax=Brevibacillus composti TaxID=2796470 RepID=A0A7T5JMZ6_9BACL|nr:RNA polymerase recycling motor HelD [Brevibacillus composti]QQE73485.1 UvrD-helicase domain-containing protein [Brevibacillus composti]QUO40567.1 UvrD-helicase domain-containing protein [Brevibacillus composti]